MMNEAAEQLMRRALEIAALDSTIDLPIAAIITDQSGSIVASSRNAVIERGEVTAHAELLVIRSLDLRILKRDARHMSLTVTLEPCPMCAWAIISSGLGKVIFGAYNPQYGAAGSVYDLLRDKRLGRSVEVVGGVLEAECQQLLDGAFSDLRHNGPR